MTPGPLATSQATVATTEAGRSPESIDRILIAACGAIWLVWLAASSIATVALVNLGRGQRAGAGAQPSSWLLYSIIGVSALTIIVAVPLLLRARRTTAGAVLADAAAEPSESAVLTPVRRVAEAPTEKMRVFGTAVDPAQRPEPELSRAFSPAREVVNRLWLRGTAAILSVIGLALIAVEAATYLLADERDTGAWVALGVAAVLTVAMPAVLVAFHRRLGEAADGVPGD